MTRFWTEDAVEAYYTKQRMGSGKPLGKPVTQATTPRPASPSYKNKWEETFAYDLVLQQRMGLIQKSGYEVMTLKLGHKKYHRPDFTIWHLDGTIEQAAVKGYHKNLRDSMTHLAWAAKEHPWFLFTIYRRKGQGWESSEVKP